MAYRISKHVCSQAVRPNQILLQASVLWLAPKQSDLTQLPLLVICFSSYVLDGIQNIEASALWLVPKQSDLTKALTARKRTVACSKTVRPHPGPMASKCTVVGSKTVRALTASKCTVACSRPNLGPFACNTFTANNKKLCCAWKDFLRLMCL